MQGHTIWETGLSLKIDVFPNTDISSSLTYNLRDALDESSLGLQPAAGTARRSHLCRI